MVRRAGFGGANTIVEPHHILISSVDDGYRGWAALEMIFHEASHTIIGRDRGEPTRQVNRAAERLGIEVPRNLSHVILFYTTGEVVRELLRERTGEEYLPYLYSRGLFENAWPEFRAPMETWWKPYLIGETGMAAAAEGVLQALR